MATLADINVRIGADIRQLIKGLNQAERELTRTGRKLSRLGSTLTNNISLPIAAAGAASIKFASDFETSFTKIETLVGITGDTLEKFKTQIGQISGPLGKSQQELSDALFTITSAGEKGEDALKTLEAASKASSIGLGETKDVAKGATAVVQAYGKSVITSTEAIDKFTAIVREGNLEASELVPTLGKVLPIAAQLGISFEEVGANIATFTRLGVSSSESVTALKALLTNLIKPSKEAQKEFAKLGISAEQLRQSVSERGLAATLQDLIKAYGGNVEGLSTLFPSVEGLANALGTAGAQGEEYLRIVESINKSNGIVEEGFEKVSNTANFKLQQALINLQNVGIQFGAAFIPVITDILSTINPLIEGFSKLDDNTQRFIVSTTLVSAAAGPTLKVLGSLTQTYAALRKNIGLVRGGLTIAVDAFKSSREALIAAGAGANLLSTNLRAAGIAFAALDKVMKISVIGVVVTAVTAAVIAFKQFNKELTLAEKIQGNLNTVQEEAEKNTVAQKVETEQLIKVIQNETSKREDKIKALKRLNEISPKYFGNLQLEKGEVNGLNKAYDEYLKNLLDSAKAKAAETLIEKLAVKQLEVRKELEAIEKQAAEGRSLSQFFGAALDGMLTGQENSVRLRKELESLEEQMKSLAQVKFDNLPTASTPQPSSIGGNIAPALSFNDPTASGGGSGGGEVSRPFLIIPPKLASQEIQAITQLNDTAGQTSERITELTSASAQFVEGFDLASLSIENMNNLLKLVQLNSGMVGESFFIMSAAMADAAMSGATSLRELGAAALEAGAKQVRAAIFTGVSQAVAKALGGVPFPFNIAAGIAAGGLATAAFNKAFSLISIPKLASGGLAFSPQLAVVGDNPGAAADPEVIAPLSKLKSYLGNSTGNTQLSAVLLGNDLVLSNDRTQRRRQRIRGY